MLPVFFTKQFLFLLSNIRKTDRIIVSFGGYWALLPSLFGYLFKKPVFIITHGTDCAAFDEISYGSLRKPFLKACIKTSYKLAYMLLPVSKSLIYTENTYFKKDEVIKQGIKYFFPDLRTPFTVIHNAVDFNKWKNRNGEREKNSFVTVLGEGQFLRKGGYLIIETAKKCPQFDFYFIGLNKPGFLESVPENVKFLGRMTPDELEIFYNKSKYYLQLSNFEGFGVALCEAMLCGCIPIVSNVNAMPDIVGDTGYILKKRDSDMLCNLLNNLDLEENEGLGQRARERIIENYSIDKRKTKMYSILK